MVSCDRCGRTITGDVIALQAHSHRHPISYQYDVYCAGKIDELLGDRSAWAHDDPDTTGLEWKLVERDNFRKPAVLEPRYENRILDLCRERGIDRDQLAAGLGTSRGAVGRWLKSYLTAGGRPMGITAKWVKRLQMYFDLDSRDQLFHSEPTGDAPSEEFVRAW